MSEPNEDTDGEVEDAFPSSYGAGEASPETFPASEAGEGESEAQAGEVQAGGALDDEGENGDEELPSPPPKPPEDPRDRRIRELHQIVADKDELLRDYIKAHKQAQAQWDQHKQRLARDRAEDLATAKGKLVERFLSVADNMERSLEAARSSDSMDALRQGMELVYKDFSQVLEQLGLERYDPTGESFDPNSMEALGVVPVNDLSQDNIVMVCLQPGFRMGERELRPALVQVGKFSG